MRDYEDVLADVIVVRNVAAVVDLRATAHDRVTKRATVHVRHRANFDVIPDHDAAEMRELV